MSKSSSEEPVGSGAVVTGLSDNDVLASFLAMRLVRRIGWERGPDDRAVLLVPRFQNGWLARRIQPRLSAKRSHVRLRLDEMGSFVWEHADGVRSCAKIIEALQERFGEDAEPAAQRVRLFVDRLLREGYAEPGPVRYS